MSYIIVEEYETITQAKFEHRSGFYATKKQAELDTKRIFQEMGARFYVIRTPRLRSVKGVSNVRKAKRLVK